MTQLNALSIMLKIDDDTVIDDNWFGYFYEDTHILLALLKLTNKRTYEAIVEEYEGYRIDEFLRTISPVALSTIQLNDQVYHIQYDYGLDLPFAVIDVNGTRLMRHATIEESEAFINAELRKSQQITYL